MSAIGGLALRATWHPPGGAAARAVAVRAALLVGTWLLVAATADAAEYPLPPDGDALVGRLERVAVRGEDTLLDVALRHEVGQREILIANPSVDRWLPGDGTEVELPTRYLLPGAARAGLVLNVPEMRLYYYPNPAGGKPGTVITYPVSIGRMDWQTPLGLTRVVAKTRNPSWRPPASIKEAAAAEGEPLADLVPPGPDNPLGTRALRLSVPGYLIHGTNRPFGVGMRVTHGCVRLTPASIEALFDRVPVGTPVRIVDQPVKIGWSEGVLFVEAHPPLDETLQPGRRSLAEARGLVDEAIGDRRVAFDDERLVTALRERTGMPVPIAFELVEEPQPVDATSPVDELF